MEYLYEASSGSLPCPDASFHIEYRAPFWTLMWSGAQTRLTSSGILRGTFFIVRNCQLENSDHGQGKPFLLDSSPYGKVPDFLRPPSGCLNFNTPSRPPTCCGAVLGVSRKVPNQKALRMGLKVVANPKGKGGPYCLGHLGNSGTTLRARLLSIDLRIPPRGGPMP